ncbi:MAG: cytochrome c3 family protein [bacterium]|nr:cytochrome c3 family protein [bacterium]
MSSRNANILCVCMLLFGALVLAQTTDVRLPGNNQGYEPEQPIAFSHRLHAGELAIDCMYCHFGAQTSRHAGVPPASVCMNCHSTVTAGYDAVLAEREAANDEGRDERRIISDELRKLYDALALDDELRPVAGAEPQRIEWVRVHDLPDYVYFDHRVHVARGLACETCHGPVQSMERVRQYSDLAMGWCVQCHRDQTVVVEGHPDEHASTDCAACHY